VPVVVLWANVSDLATGNQCNFVRRGVTCALFGSLKTTLAEAFWISCRGLTEEAGRPAAGEHNNSPVWIEQALGQGVV